jgi:amino acid permease
MGWGGVHARFVVRRTHRIPLHSRAPGHHRPSLQCHPCRASLTNMLDARRPGRHAHSARTFRLVTLAIVGGSYLTAMCVSDLSTVLGIVGATGSTTICYILPAFLYIRVRLLQREREVRLGGDIGGYGYGGARDGAWTGGWWMWAALGLGLYGLAVMTTCLATILLGRGVGH